MSYKREQEFWDLGMPVTESGCWIWTGGSVSFYGYGIFDKKRAHRLAWELTYGDIPKDMFVCHKCDIPACINPSHLFLGTHHDNMHDMSKKGRAERGERHHASSLTEKEVLEIVAARNNGESIENMAERYDVVKSAVSKIMNGQRWQWLTKIPTTEFKRGERPVPKKIKESQFQHIKEDLSNGLSQSKIALKYGVHQSTISRLKTELATA